MESYTLLIIYKDGQHKEITGVNTHGIDFDGKNEIFSFKKNGYFGYVPVSEVKYFGRAFDYNN